MDPDLELPVISTSEFKSLNASDSDSEAAPSASAEQRPPPPLPATTYGGGSAVRSAYRTVSRHSSIGSRSQPTAAAVLPATAVARFTRF